jgi:hypothetical protein
LHHRSDLDRGLSSDARLTRPREGSEIHEVLEAWSQDVGRGIECLLLLGRVRRNLCRILASGRLTDRIEREVKDLLLLINSIGRDNPASEG